MPGWDKKSDEVVPITSNLCALRPGKRAYALSSVFRAGFSQPGCSALELLVANYSW